MGRFEEQANLVLLTLCILYIHARCIGSRYHSNVPAETIIALIAQLDVQIESDVLTKHVSTRITSHLAKIMQFRHWRPLFSTARGMGTLGAFCVSFSFRNWRLSSHVLV